MDRHEYSIPLAHDHRGLIIIDIFYDRSKEAFITVVITSWELNWKVKTLDLDWLHHTGRYVLSGYLAPQGVNLCLSNYGLYMELE